MACALEEKRSPILLTERRDHLEHFAERLQSYRAIGYARDEAALGLQEAEDEDVVEFDEDIKLRGLEDQEP